MWVSNLLRKLFVAGSGATALFFLYLTYHEAQATEQNSGPGAVQARADAYHQIGPSTASGREKRVVFATVWGQTLAQDGTGFYNELADALLRDEKAGVSYQLMPYKRAKARFLDRAGACLYPSAIDVLDAGGHISDRDDFVETAPLFTTKTHLFSRAGDPPPRAMGELYGKTVAVPSGSVMQNVLRGSGATLISVHDEADKAQMLLTGRVDYMTAMLPDAVLVFAAMGQPLPEFDPAMPFLEAGVSLVCHRSEENVVFIHALNSRIRDMNADPGYRAKLFEAGIWHEEAFAGEMNAVRPASGAIEALRLRESMDADKLAAKAPVAHAVERSAPNTP